MKEESRPPTFAAITLVIISIAILLPIEPPRHRWLNAFWDLMHIPTFFIVTLLVFKFIPAKVERSRRIRIAGWTTMAAAIGSEWIQQATGRTMSLQDASFDAIGVMACLAWLIWGARWAGKRRIILFSAGANLLIFGLSPAWRLDLAEALHRKNLPDIAEFSQWEGRQLWRPQGNSTVRAVSDTLVVTAGIGRFGGVSFLPGLQDWSQFSSLEIEIENPGAPFLLGIRIDDLPRGDSIRGESFRTEARLSTGPNRLHVQFRGDANIGATIDLSSVSRLALFTGKESEERVFIIDSALLR